MPPTLSNHLWIQYVLSPIEVFVMNDDAKTRCPQRGGKNLGPEVSV